jgi:tellurite resistance protein TehA-like permease
MSPAERTEASPLAGLSPANFAIVMATGVLGVDAYQQHYEGLGRLLLVVALLAWAGVAVMNVGRLAWHRDRVLEDLRSHQRAPGFLTAVAGTSVLGSLWLLLGWSGEVAALLDAVASLLWVGLTYGILIALTVQRDKPLLAAGISGSWLLLVVATQSIAVLTVLLAATAQQPVRLMLNFGALAMWLCGGMVYVWLISLIFYRYAFLRFEPGDLAPTYWINMGAMAISALAGALLVTHAPGAPLLSALLPVLEGGSLLYWAVGTWWIPLLVGLAIWRYFHHRYPLRYDVGYWGAVFPLGMYSAATHQVSVALGLRFLAPVARGFFFVAAAAWLLTAFGLLRQFLRSVERATP